mmetsp:Transcript_68015/g.196964  ORF Transcript_68015/g.196964 Transcript_68015/m.196964 type:complete len:247 (+) Transcript_68015:571-1311(+)
MGRASFTCPGFGPVFIRLFQRGRSADDFRNNPPWLRSGGGANLEKARFGVVCSHRWYCCCVNTWRITSMVGSLPLVARSHSKMNSSWLALRPRKKRHKLRNSFASIFPLLSRSNKEKARSARFAFLSIKHRSKDLNSLNESVRSALKSAFRMQKSRASFMFSSDRLADPCCSARSGCTAPRMTSWKASQSSSSRVTLPSRSLSTFRHRFATQASRSKTSSKCHGELPVFTPAPPALRSVGERLILA